MAPKPLDIVIRSTGVDGVQRDLRLVKTEMDGISKSAEGVSHSALIGVAELSRGIGKVAEAGQFGAFAMREFTGAAFRLGEYLGPAGPFLPIIGLLGFAFYEVFTGAQKQMEETRKKFEEELDQMVNSGNVAALRKQAQDLWVGTPAKGFQDGIAALEKQQAALAATIKAAGTTTANRGGTVQSLADPETLAQWRAVTDQLKILHTQFGTLREAIADVNNMPLHFDGLAATTVTATSNAHELAEALKLVRQRIKELHEEEKQQEEDRKAAAERAKTENAAIDNTPLSVSTGLAAKAVNESMRANSLRSGNRRGGQGSGDGLDRDQLSEQLAHISLTGGTFTDTLVKGLQAARAEIQGSAQDVKSLGDALGNVTTGAVAGFGTASVSALQAFAEHSGNAGKAFTGALGNAIKQNAEQEGQLYAAKALGALGEALLFGSPGALLAAAEYTAASTAFFALAGAGGSVAGSPSGSGAAAGAPSSASGSGAATKQTTVVFKGGSMINLADPEQRAELIQNLRDLAGDGDLNFLFEN